MKKLLIIFLLSILTLVSFSQEDEYYRTVDWKFYPSSVVYLTDSTFQIQAIPIDYNDPGAIQRWVGNYVIDYVGHRYLVIDSTSTTLTVKDIYHTGQAPQSLQLARCYRSVGNGEAEYIGSVDYSPLDESARWKLNGSDNELLWRKIKSIKLTELFDVDTINTSLTINGQIPVWNQDSGYFDFSNNINNYVPDSIFDNIAGAFRLYGGEITSNGNGTVHIDAGAGIIKAINAGPEDIPDSINGGQGSTLSYVNWNEVASLSLTDNAYNYIYYEGSTGIIKTTTNFYSISFTRDFTIGRGYREGNVVTVRLCGTNAWNFNRRVQLFGEEVFPVVRATGLVLDEIPATRYFSVTSGILWAELVNRFTVAGINTQTGSTFKYYYRNGSGGWTTTTGNTQINNTQYDDGDGTLGTVLPNQFGVHWVYMVHDGSCHVLFGQDSYQATELGAISPPQTLPGIVAAYATLVGVIIIERNATEFEDVISAFEKTFSPGSSTLGGDNWGTQVVVTDGTLLGTGIATDPLKVDTVDIATQSDLAAGLATKENTLTKGNLTAGSTKVTIGGSGTNSLIGAGASIDVNEANLSLQNIGGAVTDLQVPNTITLDNITQITNRSHTNLSDIGTNTHTQIDMYIADNTPSIVEVSIATDGETTVTIPFALKSTSMVFVNYALLPNQFWEGESTTILSINIPLKKYDYIIINRN